MDWTTFFAVAGGLGVAYWAFANRYIDPLFAASAKPAAEEPEPEVTVDAPAVEEPEVKAVERRVHVHVDEAHVH